MNNTVSNDHDQETQHSVTFVIDPELLNGILVLASSIYLRLDTDPTKVGLAVLAYLRTSRRIALDEADESR